ncbi:MAG TPA: aromatic ring-hydroxylating dioxygenase subunit alpha [Thermoanaerobaculia bacterium]|nr:aromatic ring-hydroxylating dioxygenase subunit alpha [Thermoanaerobaculia bacterium]
MDWSIAEDIRRAETLPAAAYADPRWFEAARERIFARSWQLVGDADRLRTPGRVEPVTLLEGMLDEPLLLARGEDDALSCLSNVCTHRGALVCEHAGVERFLRCRYHGRRFALDGRFLSMPEFEAAEGFPRPEDDLPRLPLEGWGKLLFTALDPAFPFADWTAELDRRAGWLPLGEAVFDAARSRDYLVRANWALYCDNYLEGFHIPFVHAALAETVDYGTYRTELFPFASLQVAESRGGEEVFTPPQGHPDHGRPIAAWYFFLFPNLMVNVYPWGLSINVVKPLAPDRTRVSFLTWIWDETRLGKGAGAALDRVEREDEVVVESVHKGIAGRLYRRGRYSPTREQGVHHFHRLLTQFLVEAPR